MGWSRVKEKYVKRKTGWEREYQLEIQACDCHISDNFNRIVILNSQKLNILIPITHTWNLIIHKQYDYLDFSTKSLNPKMDKIVRIGY